MELKESGKKALGIAVGVAVATGISLLIVYLANYGLSQYANYQAKNTTG